MVRYLATLIGATDEQTMRWFILVVAMLLDPAAVLLLMAAQMTSLPGPDQPDFLDRHWQRLAIKRRKLTRRTAKKAA